MFDRDRIPLTWDDIETLFTGIGSLAIGSLVVTMAAWALSGHPETMLGYSSGTVLIAAPILVTLLVIALSIAAGYLIARSVETAPRNRPEVDVEYNGSSWFDRLYEALQDRNIQLLLVSALLVRAYYEGMVILESRGVLSGDLLLAVQALTLLMGLPIVAGAASVIWQKIRTSYP